MVYVESLIFSPQGLVWHRVVGPLFAEVHWPKAKPDRPRPRQRLLLRLLIQRHICCDLCHKQPYRLSWLQTARALRLYPSPRSAPEDVMMMLYRLVRLIESHSEALSTCLLDQVGKSELTSRYQSNVPPEDLKERVHEIYGHLGEWLMGKDELSLKQRYAQIGARRARQRVPLSEVIWVIVMTKDNLWEFIIRVANSESGSNRRKFDPCFFRHGGRC